MKNKILLILIISSLIIFNAFVISIPSEAARKSTKLGEEEIAIIENNIEALNKKVHTHALFSPEDSEKLVDVKTKLNSIGDGNLKDPLYARLFYEAAFILKEREQKQDSIQFFIIVTKNFPETLYCKRALSELKNFGINLEEESEDSER